MAFVNTYLNTDEEMIGGTYAPYTPPPTGPTAVTASPGPAPTTDADWNKAAGAGGAPTTAKMEPTFAGFQPPFTREDKYAPVYPFGKHTEWRDAHGKVVPEGIAAGWVATEAAKQKVEDLKSQGSSVAPADMQLALDQYRDAIGQARAQYTQILGHEPAPSPSEVLSLPTGSTVDPNAVTQVAPAQRLQAAMQAGTRVSSTVLNTGQADQARAQQQQNIADLQATSQGQGAGQQAAAARLKLALMRSSEAASGRAAQARGSERRGLRREANIENSRAALEGALGLEAQAQQERMGAQGQLGQQLQATRTTDVDVAAKKADLDQQRKTLQSQLDAARAANDQNAINSINTRMAELDQRTRELNAQAANTAQARKEEQAFAGQKTDIDRGLEVSRLTEEQRVGNERLKLDASKAAQDAAQGLLTENARQEQLAFAREQLRIAASQADRQFWGQLISSLLSGGAAVGAAAVTSDLRMKENIEPVRQGDLNQLARAVRDSLATWTYKQGRGEPEGEHAGPMAQDLEKTRLGRTLVRERADGVKQVDMTRLATLLAAATVRARKKAAN